MFLTTILPIKKGRGGGEISYFSAKEVEKGSLVEAPIKNKNYPGLVVECSPAEDLKTEIKSAPFALKKIKSLKTEPFFSPEWLRAVGRCAEYFAAPEGNVLSALIPSLVLENLDKLSPAAKRAENPSQDKFSKGLFLHQTFEEERAANYKSAVRESFAKGSSVFIGLPTNFGLDKLKSALEKGIEDYVFVFRADMPRKDFIKNWKALAKTDHPVLVLGSFLWLSLPKVFRTVIVEKENASGWKTLSRPFLDMRKFAEIYAREAQAKLIFGDVVLRVETIHRYKGGEAAEFELMRFRLPAVGESKLVEMRRPEAPGQNYQTEFKAVSPELLSLVKNIVDSGENIFIYAVRKGLSPVTTCRDCGEEVVCNNCASPVVLYQSTKKAENIFRCNQCGETRSAREFCKKCGSWRLIGLGVGVETVLQEIKEAVPAAKIFQIHKEATKDSKSAAMAAAKFYQTPGAVLVGTEMALYYLDKPLAATAVASIDPLFFVPDWKIREKVFRLVVGLRSLSSGTCLVQLRKAEKETLELALSGNILDFYNMEIKERELLNYPPFATFVKVTLRGGKKLAAKEKENLEKNFAEWKPAVFLSSQEKRGAEAAVNCVIKTSVWPDRELCQKILSLPLYFEVKINPENLL